MLGGPRRDYEGVLAPVGPGDGERNDRSEAPPARDDAEAPCAPERVLSTAARPWEEGVYGGTDGGRDALLARHRRAAEVPRVAGGGARGQEHDQAGKGAGESHDGHTRIRPRGVPERNVD